MLNLKAWDFGFEEGVSLAFLDGERNVNLENSRNFIRLGVDDEIIAEGAGLYLKTIHEITD